jgi:FkbM family methyltransferase
MAQDVVDILYNGETNTVTTYNLTGKTILVYFWFVELQTNLTFNGYWVIFKAGEYHYGEVPKWYDFALNNGFEIKVYVDEVLVQTKKFEFFKKQSDFLFHVTRFNEYNYPSWRHLMIDKKIDIKLKENDVLYDLGANIGVYTMWAKLNKIRQTYSFEPNPTLANDMRQTFAHDKNVAIFDHAISDKNEEAFFTLSDQSVSSGFYKEDGYKYKVQKINLENFSNKNNLLKPTIIKCDIEGSEYEFVNSISDEFLKTVRIVIFEFHFFGGRTYKDLAQVIKRFISLGYNISRTSDTKFENEMGCLIFEKSDL